MILSELPGRDLMLCGGCLDLAESLEGYVQDAVAAGVRWIVLSTMRCRQQIALDEVKVFKELRENAHVRGFYTEANM